jgi:hypothetical protein
LDVERAYRGEIVGYKAMPAGFIESKVASWLKANAGVEVGDSVTIALEARLLGKGGPKGIRHGLDGSGIGVSGAKMITDALVYGQVYYDRGNLIYLFPHSENRMSKITVNPKTKIEARSSHILGPVIVNIETIAKVEGDTEFSRIVNKLPRIK